MAFRVGLCTLGCKVAQYETEAIEEAFAARGFQVCSFDSLCDVYVVNTCTVTAESDRKCRQMLRRAIKRSPGAIVMAVGCYGQTTPQEIAGIPGVSFVGGTQGKMELPGIALALLADPPAQPVVSVTPLEGAAFERMCIHKAPRTRAYVKIEDGCECFCSYCAIPGARGPVRSKAPEDILEEIEGLARGGTCEVVLTGIEIASYGRDLGDIGLIDLLEMLEEKSSISRIRLGSLTPEYMRPSVIERMAHLRKLVPHFHLSMQSGADAVLRGMRRRYNAQMAISALEGVRAAMPEAQFTTDMMVGFPGETEEDFAETLAFSRRASFLDMHVFAYSQRARTEAALRSDQVPEAVKKDRSLRLIALAEEMRLAHFARAVEEGKPLRVLLETREGDFFLGHSDAFFPLRVKTEEDLHGRLLWARPTGFDKEGLFGELVPSSEM